MDAPIACTLHPGEYAERKAELADFARDALRARQPIDGGQRLTFEPGADTERRLRAAIEAEAECCAFLTMELHRRDGALQLDVIGPELAQPIIEELFA